MNNMIKKIVSLVLPVLMCISFFSCTDVSDVLDSNVDSLDAQYQEYSTDPDVITPSVLDVLDLMLENYVSGTTNPKPEDLKKTDYDNPDDPDLPEDLDKTNKDPSTPSDIAEVRKIILEAFENTEKTVTFSMDRSEYSHEMLYDLVYNDIHMEEMTATMGISSYTTWTVVDPINNKISVKMEFEYYKGKISYEKAAEMKKQTLAEAKRVVRDLDLANKSEYEKVYYINQYLCDNCLYTPDDEYTWVAQTAYGTLLEGSSVCEGYARSAQLLFSLCGLESYYVVGDTSEGGHAWNIVKVDGEFYQLDATWNDTDYAPNSYFLVTDDFMSLSRTWDRSRYPATADTPY